MTIIKLILGFQKGLNLFLNLSLVHNLPIFTYTTLLSTNQTNLPANTKAICWKNLELCSLTASFQAVSKYFRLETGPLRYSLLLD